MNPKSRSNQYFELGVRGRKTGWTNKPNVKRDSDGLANIDDFFDSDPQEVSSHEEFDDDIPPEIIPASRRHRMTREERRQERMRDRHMRQREEDLYSEQEEYFDQNDTRENSNTGFFEEDQVNGFLPTRPLARTPLATNNISQEIVNTGRSRKSGNGDYQQDYDQDYHQAYDHDKSILEYPTSEKRNVNSRESFVRATQSPMKRTNQKKYMEYGDDRHVRDDVYGDERPQSRLHSARLGSRQNSSYSKRVDNEDFYDSPRKLNDAYTSYKVQHSPLSSRSRRVSDIQHRDKYVPHRPDRSIDIREEEYIHSPRQVMSQNHYREPYEDGRMSKLSMAERSQSYHPARIEYQTRDSIIPERRLSRSLSHPVYSPAYDKDREISRNESFHTSSSRVSRPVSNHSSPHAIPLEIEQQYEYAAYTPEKRRMSEHGSYEQEIARSLSIGKNKLSSARSQRIIVRDVEENEEGFNDFPSHHEDYMCEQEQVENEPENYENTNNTLPKAIKGNKKGKKKAPASSGKKQIPAKREKKAVKRTDFPQDFELDDVNDNEARRSKRVKIPPLAYWRNEKVVYGRRDSGYCPVPIVKQIIRVESDTETKFYKKKATKKEPLKVEKTDLPVINYVTQKEENQQIVVTPDMIDPRTVGAGDYRFQKVFSEGDFLASGVLYLPKGSQKPNKNSDSSAMIFIVMAGQVEVQIHKTVFTVGTGAQFFVPRGNQYRLSNSGHREAKLFFCHGKEVNASASTD